MFCGRHKVGSEDEDRSDFPCVTLITDLALFGHDLCEIIELPFNFQIVA